MWQRGSGRSWACGRREVDETCWRLEKTKRIDWARVSCILPTLVRHLGSLPSISLGKLDSRRKRATEELARSRSMTLMMIIGASGCQ